METTSTTDRVDVRLIVGGAIPLHSASIGTARVHALCLCGAHADMVNGGARESRVELSENSRADALRDAPGVRSLPVRYKITR